MSAGLNLLVVGGARWSKPQTDTEAQQMSRYIARIGDAPGRCEGCAFRPGTEASKSQLVFRLVGQCLLSGGTFMCHHGLGPEEAPHRPCEGFVALAESFRANDHGDYRRRSEASKNAWELKRSGLDVRGQFYAHTIPEPNSGCLLWTGPVNTSGYGLCARSFPGKRLAHRAAWELANGPVPDGLRVLHRCDTRSCVNLDHLFLGTVADNNADRDRKGRTVALRRHGEANPSSKLTDAEVETVRLLRDQGWTQQAIADRFGVSQSLVSAIELSKRRVLPTGESRTDEDGWSVGLADGDASRVVLGQGVL